MILVDLFAGFGGFSLAGHWMGWETLMFCENASYPKKVLSKNFPSIFIHDDINDLTKEIIEKEFIKLKGYYEPNEIILTAGVPCQPASQAGKRKGTKDNRWFWDSTLRIVREIKPAYAVFENVPGILSLENGRSFEDILNALESYGYQVESFVIPACSVGAWHRRDRVWIIAYLHNSGQYRKEINSTKRRLKTQRRIGGLYKNVSKTTEQGLQGSRHKSGQQKIQPENGIEQFCSNADKFNDDNSGHGTGKISQFKTSRLSGLQYWKSEPELGRMASGISNSVERIKGLGNAIVPQVAYEIFKAIDYEKARIHQNH